MFITFQSDVVLYLCAQMQLENIKDNSMNQQNVKRTTHSCFFSIIFLVAHKA